MAPMIQDTPVLEMKTSKMLPTCSDPSVIPSEAAPQKTKDLWWMHGHPHSKRYSRPDLVSLAALVRYNAITYEGVKAFLYPATTEPSTEYKSMTWVEFDKVTENVALRYAYELKEELSTANTTQTQPTIALLGEGKTLEYFCTQLALQKLGVRVLLLAESNASSALHFLLETCKAVAAITDSKHYNTDTQSLRKINMVEDLLYDSITSYAEVDALKFQDFGDVWERHSFIIHSSGSTGIPKPIIHTNRSMMLIARMYRLFQEFNVENWFLLFPLYHIAGISIALSNLPNGQILSFPPLHWPPSSSSLFTAWNTLASMGYPVDCVHCAPTLIENMYDYITENGGDFSPLLSLKVLQPGGAALSKNIVEALVSKGVNVKTTYGSTEIGPPFRTIPHTRNNTSCYTFRSLYPDSPYLKMELVGGGAYECVVYKGFELAAELWDGKPDNEPYRTNDLFIEDPPRSGFFKLQGRRDDILVHTNGENTSAGALQLEIQTSSKLIERALVVGHSKFCTALLVEVNSACTPSYQTIEQDIWEAVRQVNLGYPIHSRIRRNMIYVLPAGNALPVTPKGNVRRKEAEKIYELEIDKMYSDEKCSSFTGTLDDFLRRTLASLCNLAEADIKDDTSFYEMGLDSRLALSLRSSVSSHLNRTVSVSKIFENPSISRLGFALELPAPCSLIDSEDPRVEAAQTINAIISTLNAEIKTWPLLPTNSSSPNDGEVILLTGGTGSLGTSLLTALLASVKVKMVYALVRGSDPSHKLEMALGSRGMDSSVLSQGSKLKVLNFCMQDPLLGLDIDTYITLAKSVTTVIHTAWKVDFNLPVERFESDCIRNTMNLLRFCCAGRTKTMAITSSISACIGLGSTCKIPELPIGDHPASCFSTGHAQSKYIIERITQTASSKLNIPVKLLRVGQLCGNTKTGNWNKNEMWPILFATSLHPSMRVIPMFPKRTIDWVPVDVAASTMTDILLSDTPENETRYAVHNIVNPHAVKWEELVSMIQASTTHKLEEIDMKEWVRCLNLQAENKYSPDELPGLRLLQFFEQMANENGESKVFETAKTLEVSRSLRDLGPFCGEWLELSLKAWGLGT